MTSKQRVMAAVRGETPDRVPVSFWYHFRLDPPAGKESKMAEAELEFYNRYKPDFLKVMHDIPYEESERVNEVGDWAKLQELEPHEGNFGKQLETLRQIRAGLGHEILMIETVFGIYYYANKISGGKLLEHLRQDPDTAHQGLNSLAKSLEEYAQACVDGVCDGIYYALAGASDEGATPMEYSGHFLEYDNQILTAVEKAPFVVLHLHGYQNLYFDLTHDLPADAICWSDRAAGPSLAEARKQHSGCIIGGIDETNFDKLTVEQIRQQAQDAINQVGGKRFILAPGCAIPETSNPELISAIGESMK